MTDPEIIKKVNARIDSLEQRISDLESPPNPSSTHRTSFESKILEKIDDIGIQNLILFALRIKSKQSKSDLKSKLESWQKPLGVWFRGGHFKTRLLDTHQIIGDGTNENGEDFYSLGSKGVKTVKKLIQKYELE